MKKVLFTSVMLISGLMLTGCAHNNQAEMQSTATTSSDNSSYQAGHSSKLGKVKS